MAGTASAETPASDLLRASERVLSGVLGALVLGFVALVLTRPPSHDETLPSCPKDFASANDCVASVSSVPETVTAALVGLGALLLVIAVLGIRFRNIKTPGLELSGAPVEETTEETKNAAQSSGKVKPVLVIPSEPSPERIEQDRVALWASLPSTMKATTLGLWQREKQGNPWQQIKQVYRPVVGHSDWYMEFEDGTVLRGRLGPGKPAPE